MYIGFGIKISNSSSYVDTVLSNLEQGCATVLLIGSFVCVSRLYRTQRGNRDPNPSHPPLFYYMNPSKLYF
ncbi:unnamed protein product [Boreogadus saida]